jgi:small subunit ribosomal protein S5
MAYFNAMDKKDDGINDRVIQIDRITRVVKGGRRLRFRAIVVAGDGNGQVGLAVDKGGEVVDAITKATRKAKSNMKQINLNGTTITHEITAEFAGARVFLKPAPKGTGVIAGGAVRPILEVLGVKDVLSKIQGSSSKLNNAYATIIALQGLRAMPAKEEKNVEKKPAEKATTTLKTKPVKETEAPKIKKAKKESGSSDAKSESRPTNKNESVGKK